MRQLLKEGKSLCQLRWGDWRKFFWGCYCGKCKKNICKKPGKRKTGCVERWREAYTNSPFRKCVRKTGSPLVTGKQVQACSKDLAFWSLHRGLEGRRQPSLSLEEEAWGKLQMNVKVISWRNKPGTWNPSYQQACLLCFWVVPLLTHLTDRGISRRETSTWSTKLWRNESSGLIENL